MQRTFSLFLLPLLLLGTGCGSDTPTPEVSTAEPITVEVAEVKARPVAETTTYSGTVQGEQRVTLSTRLMGRITLLDVEPGDRVRTGQVLVRLQRANVEAQQAQAQAQRRAAQAQATQAANHLARMEALYAESSATKAEHEQAETQAQAAQAQVEAIEAQLAELADALDYTLLEAPFSGFVASKNAEVGDLASPGQPLLTLESLERLEVVASVPAHAIASFAVNDTVAVDVDAASPAERVGVITQVNPGGHSVSRQFEVRVRLLPVPNTPPIPSGFFAKIRQPGAARTVPVVPMTALYQRGQMTGLFTVSQTNQAVLRWVRLGAIADGYAEVLSGLAPGERYIASANTRLYDGLPVVVR